MPTCCKDCKSDCLQPAPSVPRFTNTAATNMGVVQRKGGLGQRDG